MEPCRDSFESLLEEDPDALFRWINSGELSPGHLSIAAEVAGADKRSRKSLIRLLIESEPLVQEGALLGLAKQRDEQVDKVLHSFFFNSGAPKELLVLASEILLGI